MEPLIPAVLACLDHRHSYVRRNAVLAIGSLARLPRGEVLLEGAAEAVDRLLGEGGEADAGTRRAALAFLAEHALPKAAAHVLRAGEGVGGWPDVVQLAALDVVRRAVRADPGARGRFVPSVLALLASPSAAVRFECAAALTALSQAPSAVRAAAGAFVGLLSAGGSDNNAKLVVLDRLESLKAKHRCVSHLGGGNEWWWCGGVGGVREG